MKRDTLFASFTWLFLMSALLPVFSFAQEKAPLRSGYVDDVTVAVPAGAYTTFSTTFGGKRFYLGIDTTQAKSGNDIVAYYDQPCYAAMWVVGGLYSPTGAVLDDKNYLRTVKSLWIAEKQSRDRYLSLGADKGTYSTLALSDTAHSTMWYTQKDTRETSKYIQGFLYYYSDATGVATYRYLTYDPLYKFSRAFSSRPAASQRISVWDRKKGSDLLFDFQPKTFTAGWETEGQDTTKYPITARVVYFVNVDRFRSRYDQQDFFAERSAPIEDPAVLSADPYNLFGYYEWKSNPIVSPAASETYDGKSKMKVYTVVGVDKHNSEDPAQWTDAWGWTDTTMFYVKRNGFREDPVAHVWLDTIYAIGSAPVDRPEYRFLRKTGEGAPEEGDYINHSDMLYVRFECQGKSYADSMTVTRHTFHNEPFAFLTMNASPNDHVFPYTYDNKLVDKETSITTEDTAYTFTISANYRAGNIVRNISNTMVDRYEGERYDIDLTKLDGYKPAETWYDTVLVEALNAAGTAPSDWIESVRLIAKNQIRVKVSQYAPESTENRVAQIRYTFRYWHSNAEGDQPVVTQTLWLVQQSETAANKDLYTFNHTKGAGNAADIATTDLQPVHEKKTTVFALPSAETALPLHRDHWAYYRWFNYSSDKDVENDGHWAYAEEPENNLGNSFMPINIPTSVNSRGRWDISIAGNNHFQVNAPTPTPVIISKDASPAPTQVACDVSAYQDAVIDGTIGGTLNSVTEPTLSYRNIFDIHPASEQADRMENCIGDGSGENWMETRRLIVPARRAMTITPLYPIAANASTSTEAMYGEDELQYIFYFNPNTEKGTTDPNMGTKTGLDLTKASSYNRIGVTRTTGDGKYHAKLLTRADINGMTNGQTKNIIMVNPRSSSGYVLGKGSQFTYRNIPATQNDTAGMDAYKLVLEKPSANNISIKKGNEYIWYTVFSYLLGASYRLEWSANGNAFLGTPNKEMTYSNVASAVNYITNAQTEALKLQMSASATIALTSRSNTGYLSASNTSSQSALAISENNATILDDANQAWLFYEIIDPLDIVDHTEIPQWEMSTDNSTWTKVAHWDYTSNTAVSDVAGYMMLADGSLEISESKHTTPGILVYYRLRTQHFQLAKMTLSMHDPELEGPKAGAGSILPEEEIEAHYKVLKDLGMSEWSAPRTTDVTPYFYHMDWSHTEMSYHYPMSILGAGSRVNETEIPQKGEYAYLNKFVVPSGDANTANAGAEFPSLSGAENGYMLCVNADNKRTVLMQFEYPGLSCSNQEIFLAFDLCNPVKNAFTPQITATMEGTTDGGSTWQTIYRYKTGKIPYNEEKIWYQCVLPLDRPSIKDYQRFRCTAELDGSTDKNTHLLIDRLRFIEKSRTFNVFQGRVECTADANVTAVIRLDYKADPDLYEPGKLVAYQFQKWDASANEGAGGYVAVDPSTGISPAYTQESDVTGNYGAIVVPAADYDPSTTEEEDLVRDSYTSLVPGKNYMYEDDKWVIYLVSALPIASTANRTFRIGMTMMMDKDDTPTFAEEYCATFHTLKIKDATSLKVDGENWTNYTREEINADDESGDALKPLTANETYRASVDFNPNDGETTNRHCLFDLLRVAVDERNQAATDEWWTTNYGCSRAQFFAIMEIFRADNDGNPMRNITNWNDVRPEFFSWNGYSPADAERAYNLLNNLIVKERKLEIGLESRDIYLGTAQDGYFYLIPMPASGTYVKSAVTYHATVCNNPLWLEMHTASSSYSLRFGYDTKVGDSYIVPVIRASKEDANTALKVRIADITHTASSGVVIGWDSTYVIETNDPTWNPATHTFRYHQDRIVQDDIFDNYYKVPGKDEPDTDNRFVTFTPVNAEYIARLNKTDCGCYDYIPTGTVYNYNKGTKTYTENVNGVFRLPVSTLTGCNEWLVKPGTRDGHSAPGYQTANNYELKAGYWYKFKTAFFDVGDRVESNAGGDGTCVGHAEFIVAIAPDVVRWTPSHPESANFWNDDDNWTAVVDGADFHEAYATVPMGSSRVIIPELDKENLLPIVTDDENMVVNRIDTANYGFKMNTCKEILFRPGAMMWGQEHLNYKRAFVDVPFTTGEWTTFTPALDYIYAGDMYLPEDTARTNDLDFEPSVFEKGTSWSASHNRLWPYAVYQSFYNTTVPVMYQNTDLDGAPLAERSKSSADWIETNAMNIRLQPGRANIVLTYGPSDEDGEQVVVRLPKQETLYHYIGQRGGTWQLGSEETMTGKPAFAELQDNLAYDKKKLTEAGGTGITYTLNNETASKIFFFGNPTMSLIDVYQLCRDNADQLEKTAGGTGYKFTTYQLRDGASYITRVIDGPGQFYITPQHAIGLIAASATTTLEVLLKPDAMVPMTGDGGRTPAPRRLKPTDNTLSAMVNSQLSISATNEYDGGLCKAFITIGEAAGANRGFNEGEDALSLSSGLGYYSDLTFTTPLSLYTLAGDKALMLDIRDSVGLVPLVFAKLDEYHTFSATTQLSFALTGEWNRPLYLYDAVTGGKTLIMNGMQLLVEMPETDQIRYYINGGNASDPHSDQGVATSVTIDEWIANWETTTSLQERITVYDVLGREITTSTSCKENTIPALPTGVYLIKRGNHTERILVR